MWAYLSLPPDPSIVGEDWRERWLARLARQDFWLRQWTAHQRRDAYWRHGSVCEDYGRIQCAVWAVGGWEDGYSNSVPRLLAGLKSPVKGLIGPWGHAFPHTGYPGPRIGFLQECVRWWDHWLKGRDNGPMAEPGYRVWMNDAFRPETFCRERPGRWVAEPGWPSAGIETLALHCNADGLGRTAGREAALRLSSPQDTGTGSLEWCSYGGLGADLPGDQRGDDGRSLCFDGPELRERLEILGAPILHLDLSADRPVAKVAVRLCDLWPDGASARVSYALCNLTHRGGHAEPEALVPGRRYQIAIALNHVAHAFLPGHRLRVAVSTSYWPQMWPAPEPVVLTVHAGASRLDLPLRRPRPEDRALRAFDPPEGAPPLEDVELRPERTERTVRRDAATGECVVTMVKDSGAQRLLEIDLDVDARGVEVYRVLADEPLSARGETLYRQGIGRGAWRVRTETRTRMSLTAATIEVAASLDAFEGDRRVFACDKRFSVPRDLG
jgi:predicted acyl esterase